MIGLGWKFFVFGLGGEWVGLYLSVKIGLNIYDLCILLVVSWLYFDKNIIIRIFSVIILGYYIRNLEYWKS